MPIEVRMKYSILPEKFRIKFQRECFRIHDKFSSVNPAKIFHDMTGINIEYVEVDKDTFLEDILIFENEYDYTWFLLKHG